MNTPDYNLYLEIAHSIKNQLPTEKTTTIDPVTIDYQDPEKRAVEKFCNTKSRTGLHAYVSLRLNGETYINDELTYKTLNRILIDQNGFHHQLLIMTKNIGAWNTNNYYLTNYDGPTHDLSDPNNIPTIKEIYNNINKHHWLRQKFPIQIGPMTTKNRLTHVKEYFDEIY